MQNRTVPAAIGLLATIGLSLFPAGLNAGSPAIPWSQIGAKAGADYQGDGLAVSPIPQSGSARLRCVFQRLEGEATREGLWLTSTDIPPTPIVPEGDQGRCGTRPNSAT